MRRLSRSVTYTRPCSIHGQIVRKPELAGTRAALAELQEVLAARGKLHYARASVAIADIDAAVGRERNVSGEIEFCRGWSRKRLCARVS